MTYVDGFVLPVAKNKLPAYRKMAREGAAMWKKYGALEYFECVGDDLQSAKKWGCLTFTEMAKAKPSDVVIFAFIVYKSKAQRNSIMKKIMKDVDAGKDQPMPFDMKRMAMGGFTTIVQA